MKPGAKVSLAHVYCFHAGAFCFAAPVLRSLPPDLKAAPPVFLPSQPEYCFKTYENCLHPHEYSFKSCARIPFALDGNLPSPGLNVPGGAGNPAAHGCHAAAGESNLPLSGSKVIPPVFCFVSPGLEENL